MTGLPIPDEGILLTHFLTADNVERSARFYSDVLGGKLVRAGQPTVIALANAWVRMKSARQRADSSERTLALGLWRLVAVENGRGWLPSRTASACPLPSARTTRSRRR